jgi:hypothetical protein
LNKPLILLAQPTRFERVTFAFGGRIFCVRRFQDALKPVPGYRRGAAIYASNAKSAGRDFLMQLMPCKTYSLKICLSKAWISKCPTLFCYVFQ